MSVEPEIVVVSAAQGGSEQAWRHLFESHFDAVYRFSVALAGGRRDLAEETAQQVFITAAQRIGRFDPEKGPFRAWLLGIARNRYMALGAKEQRRRHHEAMLREQGREGAGPHESDSRTHDTLARLLAKYRRVLEGKYLRQLTMKQMAEADGISIDAIESLLRRARDRFARIYEQMQDSA